MHPLRHRKIHLPDLASPDSYSDPAPTPEPTPMSEWNATAYNQISALQAAMANEELARLAFKGDERVLDVGCGDGKITAEIATRVPRGAVLGVDPSRNMIEFATSHFAATRPNLRFEV